MLLVVSVHPCFIEKGSKSAVIPPVETTHTMGILHRPQNIFFATRETSRVVTVRARHAFSFSLRKMKATYGTISFHILQFGIQYLLKYIIAPVVSV